MKQAYKMSAFLRRWKKIETTGLCKVVNGGPDGGPHQYVEIQRRLFGIKIFKSWVVERRIIWADPETVTIINYSDL